MDDYEYLTHYLVRERLREAETRGALHAISGLRWLASVAWVAHLSLPKICNRL